jgi:hypothetical protein
MAVTLADARTRSLLHLHLSVAMLSFPALIGKLVALPAPIIVLGRSA